MYDLLVHIYIGPHPFKIYNQENCMIKNGMDYAMEL